MQRLLLSAVLTFSISAFASTPSQFVTTVTNRAAQILASHGGKGAAMCSLIKSDVNTSYIGRTWLTGYASAPGAADFKRMVPSIIVTKMLGMGGGAVTFNVSPNATDRGNGTAAVDVALHTGSGNPYNMKVIVTTRGSMKIIDAEYFGFSGVTYIGRDFQKQFGESSVQQVVNDIRNESGYINCN